MEKVWALPSNNLLFERNPDWFIAKLPTGNAMCTICLWEVYCCDMPYADLTFSEVTSAVVGQNLRPEIPRCCPSSFANVMKRCWDANPDKRPEMAEVVSMLEAIDTSKGGGMHDPHRSAERSLLPVIVQTAQGPLNPLSLADQAARWRCRSSILSASPKLIAFGLVLLW